MVSLLDLADITEEGVTFQAPSTGERMLLTPERSIQIQNNIGADIIMALDDVVSSVCADAARFEEATHRTLRWIDRCVTAHGRPDQQSLFAIVQGGLDPRLRDICLRGLLERGDRLPGYAIGGLAGGEEKDAFWRVVDQCTAALPEAKPRYVMGVGYPLDIVVCRRGPGAMSWGCRGRVCVICYYQFEGNTLAGSRGSDTARGGRGPLSCLGADMYDCVYPTRTARFGTALIPEVPAGPLSRPFAVCIAGPCAAARGRVGRARLRHSQGTMKLKQAAYATDYRPMDPTCGCAVCARYSRAYLHSVVTRRAPSAALRSYLLPGDCADGVRWLAAGAQAATGERAGDIPQPVLHDAFHARDAAKHLGWGVDVLGSGICACPSTAAPARRGAGLGAPGVGGSRHRRLMSCCVIFPAGHGRSTSEELRCSSCTRGLRNEGAISERRNRRDPATTICGLLIT